jgi:TRAP-type C4-dicarboxylate transport system permease small subunit
MRLPTFANKTIETMTTMLEYVVGILMVSLLLITFVEIILRFVFNNPTSWSSELARFLLIWLTFTGASVATKRALHLTMGFNIYRFVEGNNSKYIKIFINFVILFTMLLVFYFSSKIVFLSGGRTAPMTKIPMYLPWAAIPFNAFIIVIYILEKSIEIFNNDCAKRELP